MFLGSHHPKVHLVFALLEARIQSYSLLLAYSIFKFNLNWNSAPIHFTAKYTELTNFVAEIAYFPVFAQRGKT